MTLKADETSEIVRSLARMRLIDEGLEALAKSIDAAGCPNGEVVISLDIAASEFGQDGRYRLGLENRVLDTGEWLEVLFDWIARYPILSVEDPVAEDDPVGMQAFTQEVGDRVQVVGDDFLVTDADRGAAAVSGHACNAVLLKPNQAGTITATYQALVTAHDAGRGTIVSARSGETEDVSIVHLAIGWDAGQLKVGSFARSERMAKWNETLRIEEAIGPSAAYAGMGALPTKSATVELSTLRSKARPGSVQVDPASHPAPSSAASPENP